jgi:hypothetical protein
MFVKLVDAAGTAALKNQDSASTCLGGCQTAELTCMVFCVRVAGIFFIKVVFMPVCEGLMDKNAMVPQQLQEQKGEQPSSSSVSSQGSLWV